MLRANLSKKINFLSAYCRIHGEAVQKRGNFRGGGSGFSRCFPEALGKIGEVLKSNSCSVEQAVSYFRRSFIYRRLIVS